jgi:hypothetical protein
MKQEINKRNGLWSSQCSEVQESILGFNLQRDSVMDNGELLREWIHSLSLSLQIAFRQLTFNQGELRIEIPIYLFKFL